MASPDFLVDPVAQRNVLTALRIVNARSNLLGASRVLDDIALDKYTFVRDAYLQRRRSLVYDGEPPEEGDSSSRDWEDDSDTGAADKPAAASPAAPAASAAQPAPEEPKK